MMEEERQACSLRSLKVAVPYLRSRGAQVNLGSVLRIVQAPRSRDIDFETGTDGVCIEHCKPPDNHPPQSLRCTAKYEASQRKTFRQTAGSNHTPSFHRSYSLSDIFGTSGVASRWTSADSFARRCSIASQSSPSRRTPHSPRQKEEPFSLWKKLMSKSGIGSRCRRFVVSSCPSSSSEWRIRPPARAAAAAS